MSTPTGDNSSGGGNRNSNTSFPSAGSTFFADMTLDDIHDAQMESTPRSEMKFAAMATKKGSGNGSSGRLNNREEILQNVPAMPLVEEPSFDDDDEVIVTVTDEQHGHHLSPVVENQDEERVFTRITSSSTSRGGTSDNNTNFYANNTNNNSSDNNATTSILSLRQRLQQHRHRSNHNHSGRPYPRDLQWTTAFCTLLPIGLFIPHFYYSNHYIEHHNKCEFHPTLLEECTPLHSSLSSMALSTASHSTILFATFGATLLSIGVLQLLYLHPGGGDGDDIRHTNVTRTLLLSANVSVWMDIILGFMIWVWLPNARGMVVIPFSLMVRDVWWRMRKTGSALPSFRRRGGVSGGNGDGRSSNRGGAGTSVTSSHDRKTFFRALACAALDILSRSLRRKSFVRVASIILVTQFIVVSIWWGTISVILSVEIFTEDGVFTKFMHRVWLLAALVAGKWATGTVARLLGKFDSRSSHTTKY